MEIKVEELADKNCTIYILRAENKFLKELVESLSKELAEANIAIDNQRSYRDK